MRIQLVDPSAFTPPYDHALAAALARAGADVELVTSHFLYGPVPSPDGYEVTEHFYRRSARRGLGAPGRVALKLAEHVPDMRRYRRVAATCPGLGSRGMMSCAVSTRGRCEGSSQTSRGCTVSHW